MDAGQVSTMLPPPGELAVRLAGGARFTSKVVEAVWVIALVPVIVSDNA